MSLCQTFFTSLASCHYRGIFRARNSFLSFTQTAGFKNKDYEKLGLPPYPKKPCSPFFKFLSMVRPIIIEENPNITTKNILKEASSQWSKYGPEEKQIMQKEYDRESAIYTQQKLDYEKSLTQEQWDVIAEEKLRQQNYNQKQKLEAKKEMFNKPKRPSNSFHLFLLEEKRNGTYTGNVTNWISDIAQKWKTMPEETKKRYTEEAQRLNEAYHVELEKWENDMIRLGHTDIIRKKRLLSI